MKKSYLYAPLLLIVLFIVSCSGGGGGGTSGSGTGSGTATLTWDRPTQYVDNSSLNDLGGFKIYYTDTGGMPYKHVIDVGNVTTYQITNIPTGAIYYFTVRAYNQAGVESDVSNELSKMIN